MTDPPKSAAHSDEPPEITPEASLAADDPTAVWDVDALRDAGLDELLERPETESTPPATAGRFADPPSIQTPLVDDEPELDPDATEAWDESPLPPQRVTAPTRQSGGWGATLTLAFTLGAAVYFAVRFLR